MHLAYRWFCRLNLDDKVPHHSNREKALMKAIAEHTAPLEAGIAQHAVRIAELENVVRALVENAAGHHHG